MRAGHAFPLCDPDHLTEAQGGWSPRGWRLSPLGSPSLLVSQLLPGSKQWAVALKETRLAGPPSVSWSISHSEPQFPHLLGGEATSAGANEREGYLRHKRSGHSGHTPTAGLWQAGQGSEAYFTDDITETLKGQLDQVLGALNGKPGSLLSS